ncbi:hypothetical protein C8R43DRAFT_1210542 [Mycena crocata]|nr:hypothetical protein C8R43DRAFT_1210542 [Mycena crocata]
MTTISIIVSSWFLVGFRLPLLSLVLVSPEHKQHAGENESHLSCAVTPRLLVDVFYSPLPSSSPSASVNDATTASSKHSLYIPHPLPPGSAASGTTPRPRSPASTSQCSPRVVSPCVVGFGKRGVVGERNSALLRARIIEVLLCLPRRPSPPSISTIAATASSSKLSIDTDATSINSPQPPPSPNANNRRVSLTPGGTTKVLSDLQTGVVNARDALENTKARLRLAQRSVAQLTRQTEDLKEGRSDHEEGRNQDGSAASSEPCLCPARRAAVEEAQDAAAS